MTKEQLRQRAELQRKHRNNDINAPKPKSPAFAERATVPTHLVHRALRRAPAGVLTPQYFD